MVTKLVKNKMMAFMEHEFSRCSMNPSQFNPTHKIEPYFLEYAVLLSYDSIYSAKSDSIKRVKREDKIRKG
jgi:hypothetical protein